MDDVELRPIVEALLFVATEPLSLDRLRDLLDGVERSRLSRRSMTCARHTGEEPRSGDRRGRRRVRDGDRRRGGAVDPQDGRDQERARLSKPALETLAIVAYKQPLTRPEIEAIRASTWRASSRR
jgi:segregation and condensation protein B